MFNNPIKNISYFLSLLVMSVAENINKFIPIHLQMQINIEEYWY